MRIVIDLLMAEKEMGTQSSIIYTLLEELARVDESNEYWVLTTQPDTYQKVDMGQNMHLYVVKWRLRDTLLLNRQFLLPDLLRRLQPDVLHVVAGIAPIGWDGSLVMMVPDLKFLELPSLSNQPINRLYWHYLLRESLQRAERIITTSEHANRELISTLGVERERILACYGPQWPVSSLATQVAITTIQAYQEVVNAGRRKCRERSL
ncbi:MAG TPA: glycosyltransferase [Ktedonosporobacter sp.]|nr:glycosyltransferase [Ktedonosporobacter sp.]